MGWADRNEVAIGDPVDQSKRLDGTANITYA
jgi:hypothetical protein